MTLAAPSRRKLRLIQLLCLIPMGLSLWIAWLSFNDQITTLQGCGADSECANVLGSHWAYLFQLPVSAFSCIFYLTLIALLQFGNRTKGLCLFSAWLLLGVAAWFTFLQAFVLHAFCTYCLVSHGAGVVIATLILLSFRSSESEDWNPPSPQLIAAVIATSLFAGIQYFTPRPPTHKVKALTSWNQTDADDLHSQGVGRQISFFSEQKHYNIASLPHIGSSEADVVIIKYFDYTCKACRDMHLQLEEAIQHYDEELAVILLPAPRHRDCNPYRSETLDDFPDACQLAQLALIVWREEPKQFAAYHQWLMTGQRPSPYEAMIKARSLLGDLRFEACVSDPWPQQLIQQTCKDYSQLSQPSITMPKLLLTGNQVMHGTPRNSQALIEALKPLFE